jgi:4a-hydroxytetrahydrobiopterin dehydratase
MASWGTFTTKPLGLGGACDSGGMVRRLDDAELERQLLGLPGWVGGTLGIGRSYELPDYLTAIRAVDEIALVAEEMNHHPDIDIRWRRLDLVLTTHDAGGVSQLDIELAHRIHEIARHLAATDLDG